MSEDARREAKARVAAWAQAVCAGAAPQLREASPPVALSPEAAAAVGSAVERRLRHLLGEATKRTVFRRGERLTGDDVNGALEALGDERCLGHPRRELVATTGGGASLPPRELRLRDVEAAAAARSLSNALVEPSLGLRWLSVDGRDAREHDGAAAEGPPPWARLAPGAPAPGGALGREQELYLRKVVDAVRGRLDVQERREVFRSLARDAGLESVVPHLAAFLAEEANRAKKRPVGNLRRAVDAIGCVARNRRSRVELHLHRLVPVALTCVVAKKLGLADGDPGDGDHWDLRVAAARTAAAVCAEFGDAYATLRPRVSKTYADALADGAKPLATHFGALVGLRALGPLTVASLVIPRAAELAARFDAAASAAPPDGEDAASRARRLAAAADARHCLAALADAAAAHGRADPRRAPAALDARPTLGARPPRRLTAPKPAGAKRPAAKRKRGADGAAANVDAPPAPQKTAPASPPRPHLDLLDALGEALVPHAANYPATAFI